MKQERTFLDPLNGAQDILLAAKDDLASFVRALHKTGNSALADNLASIAVSIGQAIKEIDEGRNMALRQYTGAVEEGTSNMVRAAIAIMDRPQ